MLIAFRFILRNNENLMTSGKTKFKRSKHQEDIKMLLFFLWRFDPIPGHGLPLRSFAITHPLDTQHSQETRHPCPRDGFEHPSVPSQSHALERSAFGIGKMWV